MHPMQAVLFAVAAICAGAAVYAWQRRDRPGAVALVVLLVAVAEWNAAYAFGLGSTTLEAKLWWARVQYVGVVSVPVAALVFALDYRGHARAVSTRNLVLLAAVPALVLVGAWTNDLHGLIWRETVVASRGSLRFLTVTHGPGFFAGWAYAYVLLFAASVVLVSGLLHARRYYRRQFALIVVAIAAPWAGNVLYVLEIFPGPRVDFTNLGFAVSALALTIACLRGGLLEVMPVVRDFVVEHMDDAMVVVDSSGRIVDCNDSAGAVLRCRVSEAVGMPAAGTVAGWERMATTPGSATLVHVRNGDGLSGPGRVYEARVTTVPGLGARGGRLLLFHDVTARERLQAHLRERALTDALTGLPNRRLLFDRIEHALAKASRSGELVAVLFCDLDDFKPVNDTYGHDCGDEALQAVAAKLAGEVRPGDTVARLGGDEFAVLLEGLSSDREAEEIAGRLAARLAEPVDWHGHTIATPASIGVAVTRAGASTPRDLLREADQAMYLVKGDPATRVAVAGSEGAPTA